MLMKQGHPTGNIKKSSNSSKVAADRVGGGEVERKRGLTLEISCCNKGLVKYLLEKLEEILRS